MNDRGRKLVMLSIIVMLLLQCNLAVRGEIVGVPLISDSTRISLLTCTPDDGAVYTLYGHTAIRLYDRVLVGDRYRETDIIFNYGVFDFTKPNFIYRFTKGETDYMLAWCDFSDFISHYAMRGSGVAEQLLNLTSLEKSSIIEALRLNARPENRVYRYNFFFDNCSTRPAAIIESNLSGALRFPESELSPGTFREMINHCTRRHPWLTFGCDLALGAPTDRAATFRESLLLPEKLKLAYASAEIVGEDGSTRPLVAETRVLVEPDPVTVMPWTLTPVSCAWLLLVITLVVTCFEWRRRAEWLKLDSVLFAIAGLSGCVLFFLSFFSEHPCTYPNYSLLYLHPLHLFGAVVCGLKRFAAWGYRYHIFNCAILTIMLCSWRLIPQQMNDATIPLVLTLLIRSIYSLITKAEEERL